MTDIEKVIEELNNANKELIGTDLDVVNGIDIVYAIDEAIQTIRELRSNQCHLNSPCEYQDKDIKVEDVCEWNDSFLSGSEYKTNPHNKIAMSWKYLKENNMLYCPSCGRKIKVVEE